MKNRMKPKARYYPKLESKNFNKKEKEEQKSNLKPSNERERYGCLIVSLK